MEDRVTPALYLEMTEQSEHAYVTDRVPEVLAASGVERATWWQNELPNRSDLPRVLPEFNLLGVYEVDPSFQPPVTPDDIRSLHYRRTPRPGQGRLTGLPTIGISLVLISPRSVNDAQALRDWADLIHIRHIAEVSVPGYSMITPYELATGSDDDDPRFLHFYEMDSQDPEATFQTMTPLVTTLLGDPGTPAWDKWANHPALRIMYVNTFKRLGEQFP
ncbi:MAG: hypothetical protein EXQ69_06190 [Acidimicrobiia bacterium]|nr:hypothetical protein [Acidimicrobiia bacterium]